MKKTLIALMVLAGVAAAENFTYDNLFNENGWTAGSLRDRNAYAVENGQASLTNSNWGQAWANYTLNHNMTEKSDIEFSITLNVKHTNGSFLFFLETDTNAYLIGKDYEETDSNKGLDNGLGIWYGKGEKHPYNTYAFGTQLGWDENTYQDDKPVTDQNNLAQDVIVANTPITLAGIIAWDGDSYNMNLSMGDVKVDWDLGASFNLQKVGFWGDGANGTDNVVWSNLKISAVPEPTTATLSLLALAGLAVRRRRK